MKIKYNVLNICIYLIFGFAILISFSMNDTFLLDSPGKNIRPILDIFYGKDIPIGGSLPISLIAIFQKIIFFIILILGSYSIHNLIERMTSVRIAPFYASFLYMFNPYTYIRIVTGQLFLLFSYAIFPFLLKTFIDLLEKKEKKKMIKFILLLSIVAFNMHMLVISLIIMTIIFLFWSNKYRDIRTIKLFVIIGILFILLNSYWIIPVLTTKNTIVDNITDKDIEVFAPKGSLFEIAAMYGFWREGYIYTRDILPGWQILYLIILSLSIIGFLAYYKDEKIGIYIKAFGLIGIIGFILATGINGPFGYIDHWLYDNTILRGFRDSHKFVAMLTLSYSFLGAVGLDKIKNIYYNIRT